MLDRCSVQHNQPVHFSQARSLDVTTLQKVSIVGGRPVTVAESPSNVVGASWGDDHLIFGTQYGTENAGLFRAER